LTDEDDFHLADENNLSDNDDDDDDDTTPQVWH
jgi:hypothetical protein